MIELTDVRKVFHAGKPRELTAVDGVSLTVGRGRLTVLKGPSGSGKTTLLALLGCMARPTAGRIRLRGVPPPWLAPGEAAEELEVTSLPERFLTEIRRATFGFVFQQYHLVRGITALENVLLPTYPTGEARNDTRARALELLDRFALGSRALSHVDWLSGGEMQRVAISRALINRPLAVIADEPTAHLDTRLSREFLAIAGELKAGGTTLIVASHDPLVCESELVDEVVEMRDGQVVGPRGAP